MKLIVTGHDAEGRSVFSFAGAPPRELHPGAYELWTTRGALEVPDATDAERPPRVDYFPRPQETSFKVVTVPPASSRSAPAAMADEIAGHFDADDPEMHTTDTIDYVIVLSGAADLELDDGRREPVRAGDCVVQRGTRHAWRVTGEEPLVLGAVLLGATRSR